MEKQNLNNGKKLNKKELRTIAGGVKICSYNGVCTQYGPSCYELACQEGGGGSLRCTDIVNKCVVYSIECVEPKCRFDIGIPL
ncbi:hypothetical protein KB553_05365 [Chryseobacterium rhizoplanae]|uniref:hypothetical protein n=1 Tax=Chryseobacterium rhizoplanae TaxID=1609531 RepID=UPI001CE2A560|nr:hypothetical protein [Chryseobacterium rhizoplanae]UCA60957.1 hypothetical protein KB553_05365 [Chryseobacterium rhizoplanae]